MASTTATTIRRWLAEYDDPGADAAWLLCDRHDPDAVAFTFTGPDLGTRDMTYGELAERSRRLATVLAEHGVRRGNRVPVLMGKRPELVVTLMALWRLGAVHVPLFTAFETGAVTARVEGAGAALVVTEAAQRAKLDAVRGARVLDVDELERLAATAVPLHESVAVGGDGIFLQLYTSGTTGRAKGVPVPLRALAAFRSYLYYGVDVRAEDVYWNAADPGWAYGLYYAIVAPLAAGQRSVLLTSGFAPDSTATVLRGLGVTNFAGAPTMYRAMSRSGRGDWPALRRACSAGEPLTPDVVAWGRDTLGVEVRDHYGQTELGMVICNCAHDDVSRPLKEGSMGGALPGFTAAVRDGRIVIEVAASPLMWFTGYHEAPERTAERFSDDGAWYLTGDAGRADEDGYFFFTARDDDVILAGGYRIGPFEVESVLIDHPGVADVAVVGRPDPEGVRGEVVVAYVVPAAGVEAGDQLAHELQKHVRDRYSRHAYPRAVHFVDALPRTPSGKIQRHLLRRS